MVQWRAFWTPNAKDLSSSLSGDHPLAVQCLPAIPSHQISDAQQSQPRLVPGGDSPEAFIVTVQARSAVADGSQDSNGGMDKEGDSTDEWVGTNKCTVPSSRGKANTCRRYAQTMPCQERLDQMILEFHFQPDILKENNLVESNTANGEEPNGVCLIGMPYYNSKDFIPYGIEEAKMSIKAIRGLCNVGEPSSLRSGLFRYLDKGLKCSLSKFADDIKLSCVICTPEEWNVIQRNLDKVKWAHGNTMRFNTTKCKVLHLIQENP
ncbi:hypothetical protein WISP_27597 [Willisornis vidua]|uniref:Reverse transcriptase domain-containing protein n=1 Tax=Willisornis vidua TaxID=1566151 RepID=A0ABQ9DSH2_9PASS|nr:hypothetical protein WISP_27597 [Willisornis vidua]